MPLTSNPTHPDSMGKMKDWGEGMLMTGHEYDEVHAFDEQLGLRELRAKVNGKAGITDDLAPNRFSINAEFNYGTRAVGVVRKYLDSGALLKLLEDDFWKDDRCWDGSDSHRYNTLLACVMTLGCKLPEGMKKSMWKLVHPAVLQQSKKIYPKYSRSPLAISQLREAIDEYKEGEPYNFGNTTFLETTTKMVMPFPGKRTFMDFGSMKLITITTPAGITIPQIIGPPGDDEVGLTPIYPNHLCARCGKATAESGKDLSVCAHCHDRKYCSRECQKRHWKFHKTICMLPPDQIKAVMDNIPSGFKEDDEMKRKMAMEALGGK